ncbi:glycine N-methyltransferase [Trichonephila clavipes]|nr:glycine N-methyltransferase [Trichonephila clavipes]
MADTTFRLRSLGIATEGLPDQYADGKAAKVWEIYIGEKNDRTKHYREFLVKLLNDHSCYHILDVACGTGIDSILLLEEGFKIMSVDASDKMLKYALKERWNRRNECSFNNWDPVLGSKPDFAGGPSILHYANDANAMQCGIRTYKNNL